MPSLSTEDYRYFENAIYLPMLITVLERDAESFVSLPFKLPRPYITLVEQTLKRLRADLKVTSAYLTRYNMRLVREKIADDTTEYTFISSGFEERRKYSNAELRQKSEELLITYFTQ